MDETPDAPYGAWWFGGAAVAVLAWMASVVDVELPYDMAYVGAAGFAWLLVGSWGAELTHAASQHGQRRS